MSQIKYDKEDIYGSKRNLNGSKPFNNKSHISVNINQSNNPDHVNDKSKDILEKY